MMNPTEKNNSFIFLSPLSISEFSSQTKLDPASIIKYFFLKGKATTLNTVLDKSDCQRLCEEYGLTFEEGKLESKHQDLFEEYLYFLDSDELVDKPPVVTVMGHVDHGKTTLLDRIRGSKVAAREFGGITQHIGAYQVDWKGKLITFVDTPGHKAFTKMRARGANVTDIVVLVVAADDGIKPQTIEAIQHALAAKVKIIVFINKMDKGIHNLHVLKQSLMDHGVVLEEYGGDVVCCSGSALTGDGIDELLESIILISEMSGFKTVLVNPAIGVVIESNIDKGLGPTASVLLYRGKIKPGDFLVMQSSFCKVKSMISFDGKPVKEALPSLPVKVSGFKALPKAGDRFISCDKESKVKEFMQKFAESIVVKEYELSQKSNDSNFLNVVIKSDVSGSLDALKEIIKSFEIPIISANIGIVTDVDLQLASISNAMVINFNQPLSQAVINRAREMKISLKNYRSVYELEEEIVEILEKNRVIDYVDEVTGRAKVVKLWHHSKVGTIAGCKVISGTISKTDKVRVIRNSEILTNSTIKSFKTESYEIKECSETQECGIVVNNWNDIKPDDIIESYVKVEKK